MARSPKTRLVVADDLQDAVGQLTSYLQREPLATAALLTLAVAIGAGASSIGRRGSRSRKAALPVESDPGPAATPAVMLERPHSRGRPGRRPGHRKGLGVAAFELDQREADGRRTEIDFTWTGPKPKPGPAEPEAPRRESKVGVALFEMSLTRPGAKDTAIRFAWSKEPLEPPLPPPAPEPPPEK